MCLFRINSKSAFPLRISSLNFRRTYIFHFWIILGLDHCSNSQARFLFQKFHFRAVGASYNKYKHRMDSFFLYSLNSKTISGYYKELFTHTSSCTAFWASAGDAKFLLQAHRTYDSVLVYSFKQGVTYIITIRDTIIAIVRNLRYIHYQESLLFQNEISQFL